MPVFLRRFYLKQLEKTLEEQAKAIDEASSGKTSSKSSVSKPGIMPK